MWRSTCHKYLCHFLIEKEALPNLVPSECRICPILAIVAPNIVQNYLPSALGLFVPTGVLVHLLWAGGKPFLHLRIHAGASVCEKERI